MQIRETHRSRRHRRYGMLQVCRGDLQMEHSVLHMHDFHDGFMSSGTSQMQVFYVGRF